MRRWTERAALILMVLSGLVWVGAKIHFLARLGARNVDGYLAEHWPFWAVMVTIGALLIVLGIIEPSRTPDE
jgi:hypothetical protein